MLTGSNVITRAQKAREALKKWEAIRSQKARVAELPMLREGEAEMLVAQYIERGGEIHRLPAAYASELESKKLVNGRTVANIFRR